jgi:MFS transporter, FHS family, glucose/mannose:H+ symporter
LANSSFKNYLNEFPNYLSLFLMSFFMMLASPILLDIGKTFKVSPENMNLIITFFMAGEIIGILALMFLIRKFNKVNVNIWAYAAFIPTLIGLFLTTSLIFFYILYFISGCLFGIIFMNANLSMLEGDVENKDSVVNLGHGFFAIGALTSPLIASDLINRQINWRIIYLIAMGIVVISLFTHIFTARNKLAGLPVKEKAVSLKEFFSHREKNIYMLFTVILMMFYVMSEVTIFSWAPTFFRVEKLFDLNSASVIISIFWIGILVGRLIISFLSYKFKAGTLLLALSIISIAGLFIAIFPNGQNINYIGAGLIGLGFSGIPPLLISTAGKIFGSGRDFSLSILFVVGISSGSIIPFVIRFVATYSYIISIAMAIIFMASFLIFVVIRKYFRKNLKAL